MPCRCTSLSPLLFFCYKEVYGALQKPCQCATDSSDSSCCLTKYIIDNVWPSNCSRFTHTCTHDNTHSVIFNHTRTHAPTHTRSHTHTHTHADTHTHTQLHAHPIQYSSRHKRGKTCRHGHLSKQLQQIETKLNLKPRATPASERL